MSIKNGKAISLTGLIHIEILSVILPDIRRIEPGGMVYQTGFQHTDTTRSVFHGGINSLAATPTV
jgi:hypothetical protein